MKARRIEREYVGLVHGVPPNPRGTIEGPIGRDPRNRLKFAIVSDGKPAITHYALREAFPKHAELVFRLETGRTHQIRVHLAAAGYPILNDPLYGKKGKTLRPSRSSFARGAASLSPPAHRRANGVRIAASAGLRASSRFGVNITRVAPFHASIARR